MYVPGSNNTLSDECLIDAIVKGDLFAMETLYERYSRPLFSLAYRTTASKQVAEDLVQVVFLAIWRNRALYTREAGSVRSWFFSIMHYRILDYCRSRRCRSLWKEIPWEDVEFADIPLLPDPWEGAWRLEQAELVHEAMQKLPGEQQIVINLAYFEGLTHEEIARSCHIPLGTVKSRLRLGLHHLKHTLIGQGL